jgi:hypothetical protein
LQPFGTKGSRLLRGRGLAAPVGHALRSAPEQRRTSGCGPGDRWVLRDPSVKRIVRCALRCMGPEGSASPEPDTHRDRQQLDVLAPDEHAVIPGLSEHAKGAHGDVDAGAAVETEVGVLVL